MDLVIKLDSDDYLDLIKLQIDELYNLQMDFNINYPTLLEIEDEESIIRLLKEEKYLLKRLCGLLDKYFDINPFFKFSFNTFTIDDDSDLAYFGRYEIIPPLFLDKGTIKYAKLTKTMVELHKEYFFRKKPDGMFANCKRGNIKSRMWEIPNFIDADEYIKELRRKINERFI